jgi:hypothetical protein
MWKAHDVESKRGLSETAQREFRELVYLAKASLWAYEAEWRIIQFTRSGETVGLSSFPSQALIGVVWGCQATLEKHDQVRDWIAASACAPTIYHARISRTKFALEIEALDGSS